MKFSLSGLNISKEDALELINRMNKADKERKWFIDWGEERKKYYLPAFSGNTSFHIIYW